MDIIIVWSSFIACITSAFWTDDIIVMPHPLTTTDHLLIIWFQRVVHGVWSSGRPIIYWITLEGGVTHRDGCCVGVYWIVLKVEIVNGGGCTVGVVTALPV